MSDLFCPKCDYNLTGLTENRCPECGTVFDPEELARLFASSLKRIGLPVFVFHLLWPPGLFAFSIYVTVLANLEWLWGTLVIALVVFAFLQTTETVRRFAATSSVRRGGSPVHQPPLATFVRSVIGLVILQLALAYVGCRAAWVLAY